MPDVSDQSVEGFVVEPVTQLDGSPAPQRRRLVAGGWREKLGQPGMIALAEGLALLCSFFLPWLSFPTPDTGNGLVLESHSGWITALGILIQGIRFSLFVHLWLIPITAAALLVIAWLHVQRRLSARQTIVTIIALSALALLIEIGFYWQVIVLNKLFTNDGPPTEVVAVLWGYWAAILVNAIALGAAAYLLRPIRPRLSAVEADDE